MTIENTNSDGVVELSLTAHDLEDRSRNASSLRQLTQEIRYAFVHGTTVKTLAARYGASYEWVRRIAKNVAYDYDDATIELVNENEPVAVTF
jgi:hypothetical protein